MDEPNPAGTCIELPVSDLALLARVERRAGEFGMSFEAALKQALSMFLLRRGVVVHYKSASPPKQP
jgi:hypothetical protein